MAEEEKKPARNASHSDAGGDAPQEKKESVDVKHLHEEEEVKEEKPIAKEVPKKKEKVEEKPAPRGAAKKEEEIEIPKKFEKLVKEIEGMKVVDLAELVKILEKKFGVSAAPPVAVAAAPVAGAPGAEAGGEEEKAEYDIILKAVGDKKIEVIKAVRDATAKGLKEAKDMVDAAASEPQTVRERVKKEEAEELKKKFEAAGATVELK